MGIWRKSWDRLQKAWAIYVLRPLQIFTVSRVVEHVSGPLDVPYAADELIVLCLARDGELYVNSFIQHYARLGVKHIFLLDNGSIDRTVELAHQYPGVTILRARLPFRRYKMAMRHYLVRRFAQPQRWALYVDIDELLDYPFSQQVSLGAWLGYLRERGYTAVIAYMLDMFSDKPLTEVVSDVDDDLMALYRCYDISDVVRMDYYFPRNHLPTDALKAYFGGIRRTLFAPDEIRFVLTKHPLFFLDGKLKPLFVDEHFVRDARIADVTAVLFHYKFLGDFAARTVRAVQEENYHTHSEDYKKYLQVINQSPDMRIKRETSREFQELNELIGNQFLYVSSAYEEWASTNASEVQS
ncbi:MAG: glycosyltransferase family 2 protein [Ardenticatenaceae bacterium]|nr:glycosyltransferase family 2 protein [Anaerolineales bacterium]MCB8922182.1 glycosyltransferase family 2 protein [Ardenticatenaceae bacterium]